MGSPTLGTLLPNRFINLAERNGMIVPLTTFVIEEACRQVERWRRNQTAEPLPFVSVNVSVRNICDPGFISVVKTALAHCGLPPHTLQLELTENAVLGKDETSVTRLQQLSAMGLPIAIDIRDRILQRPTYATCRSTWSNSPASSSRTLVATSRIGSRTNRSPER